MDSFDVRKYITENRINDQDLEEAKLDNRVDSILAYYEAETGKEADEDIEYTVKHMAAREKSDEAIKAAILSEQEDVLDPDEEAMEKEKEEEASAEDNEEWFDKENAEKIRPQAEKIIAKNIVDAYAREDGKRPQISKRLILSIIKDKKESDYMNNYLPEFDMESPEKAVKVVLGTTFANYLDSKVDDGSITSADQASNFISDLSDIFYPNFPTGKITTGLKNYIKNVSNK